jgi:hypothetical protein
VNEVDHSAPASAKVKNEDSYTSTPPIYTEGVDRNSPFFMEFMAH